MPPSWPFMENTVLEASCFASEAFPAPDIKWYIGDEEQVNSTSFSITSAFLDATQGTALQYSQVNSVRFQVSRYMNNQRLECGILSLEPWDDRISAFTEILEVEFPPRFMNLSFSPDRSSFQTGETVQITCISDSSIPSSNMDLESPIFPTVSGTQQNGLHFGQEVKAEASFVFNRDMEGMAIECIVYYESSIVLRESKIIGGYSPHNVTLSSNAADVVLRGDIVTFTCEASGGTPATVDCYTWEIIKFDTINGNQRGSMSTTCTDATIEIEMEYATNVSCSVTNGGVSGTSDEILIRVHYKPELIESTQTPMEISIGEILSIDLSVAAYPYNDVTFTWISPRGNQTHSSAIIAQPEVVRTVYIATVEEYGDYVCRATNVIGTSTFVFEVTEEADEGSSKSNSFPLVIVAAAGGGGFLVLMFIIIVCVYCRRNRNAQSSCCQGTRGDVYEEARPTNEDKKQKGKNHRSRTPKAIPNKYNHDPTEPAHIKSDYLTPVRPNTKQDESSYVNIKSKTKDKKLKKKKHKRNESQGSGAYMDLDEMEMEKRNKQYQEVQHSQREESIRFSYENQSEWVANASYADHKDLAKTATSENKNWVDIPKDVEIQKVTKIVEDMFGEIWKAQIRGCDCLAEVSYFVRWSTAKNRKEIEAEIQALKQISNHPHIVPLEGVQDHSDTLTMVMPYYKDGTLQQFVDQYHSTQYYTQEYIFSFAEQIADALIYLHSQTPKMLHPHLTMESVFLEHTASGLACRLFGFISEHRMKEREKSEKKNNKVHVYRPVEILNHKIHTFETDVWDFGFLLYRLILLGAHPNIGKTDQERRLFIISGQTFVKPDACSKELFDVVKDCTAHKSSNRAKLTEVRERLQSFESDGVVHVDVEKAQTMQLYANTKTE